MSEATQTPEGDSIAEKPMTRGQFLTAATVGVGGVMGALLAAPVAGLALGPVFGGEDFEPAFLGNVDEFSEGSFTKVVLTPHAEKPDAYVRKKVAFVRRNTQDEKTGEWSDQLVVPESAAEKFGAGAQGEFSVISNVCMHLGCPVQAGSTGFVCPCHGGSYGADGERSAGPPVRPLDRYIWKREGDELWAVAIVAMKQDGGTASHRDPGQHTSGPESLFYPLQP